MLHLVPVEPRQLGGIACNVARLKTVSGLAATTKAVNQIASAAGGYVLFRCMFLFNLSENWKTEMQLFHQLSRQHRLVCRMLTLVSRRLREPFSLDKVHQQLLEIKSLKA